MAMEAQQQRKRRYCDCGFEISTLSDYHMAQHKQTKQHRQAMSMAANKMQRLDSYFSKPAAAHKETMETVMDLELNDTLESRELGEYHY